MMVKSRLSQTLALVTTQVLAGVVQMGALGLILGYAVARYAGAAVLAPASLALWRARLASPSRTLEAASSYRAFPLVSTGASLLNASGIYSPIILLGILYSPSVVGWFSLTFRVLQTPAAFAGQAVAQAFFSRAARVPDAQLRAEYAQAVYQTLLVIATAPAMWLVLLGPDIFAAFFGEEWRRAGDYARWLAPWTVLVFAASPLSSAVFIARRQRRDFAFQVALATGRPGAILAGALLGDAILGIQLFGATSALLWLPYALWLMSLNGIGWIASTTTTLRELVVAAAISMPLGLSVVAGVSEPWSGVGVLGSLLLYGAYVGMRFAQLARR
jgi:O-antigen/teichoic acid export membrane protein